MSTSVTRRMRSGAFFMFFACAALVGMLLSAMPASAGAAGFPPTRPAKLLVELWGDSLSAQAADYFRYYLGLTGGVDSREHVYGGTALCDWLPDMRSELSPSNRAAFHPDVALVQFSGNAFTPCMQDSRHQPLVGQALVARYQADSATVVTLFGKAGVPVYFVSSPISRGQAQQGYVHLTPLGVMFAQLPTVYPSRRLVRYIDAAAAVELGGHYTDTLPCLPWETCTGHWKDGTKTVVVRQDDGTHFCPVREVTIQGVVARCPVYSGGATRFALAMTGRIAADFHIR